MRRSASRGHIPSVVMAGMAEWQRGHGARAWLLEGGRAVGQAFDERYGAICSAEGRHSCRDPKYADGRAEVGCCDAACGPCRIGCIM